VPGYVGSIRKSSLHHLKGLKIVINQDKAAAELRGNRARRTTASEEVED
jgi:hypothetical protein